MARCALALAAVVVLLVPATASADWLPIEAVGTISPSNQQVRIASNDRGDTVLLWGGQRDGGEPEGLQVSVSRRGGPFGEPMPVPGSVGGAGADVDVNEDGRAIVWWSEFVSEGRRRYKLVGLKVDGGFGKPRVVTPTDPNGTFDPVIGPGGRFAFIYTVGSRNRPVYARIAPPSGKLGRRITLATGSIRRVQLYYLGNRPMIDYLQASDDYSRIREREIGRGGATVIGTIPKNGTVVMDTATNGMQVALWTGGNSDGPKRPLMGAVRRPGGVFGKGNLFENRVPPQEYAVAVSRTGAAIVAWREWNEPITEDVPSPTPEYEPGNIVYSYKWEGGGFSAMGRIRPEEERTFIEDMSADIDRHGMAVLGFQAERFRGIQQRLYTANIYRGDPPALTPMTDYTDLSFVTHRVEIDEQSRTTYGWVDGERVFARRGTWLPNQP